MSQNVKIRLANIEKFYSLSNGDKFHALKNLNLDIYEGEIFGIIGRSGAGKSTLIRLINLLEKPTEGQVIIDGEEVQGLNDAGLRQLRQKVGMVFQHFNLLNSKTVLDNVTFPLKIAGVPKDQQEKRALELLELVGLSAHARKYPAQLSGGQKQRVGIARSLANNPDILLCDEATSALDPETTQSILALLKDLSTKLGLTVVLITHSMDVIRGICDRVAVIDAGRIVELDNVVETFLHPKQAVTKSLLAETGINFDNWQTLRGKFHGHVILLTYTGDDAAHPVLSDLTLQYGIKVNILQGTVGQIGDVQYGQLVVSLECSDELFIQAKSHLTQCGVTYEELADE